MEYTTIKVSKEVHEKLCSLGKKGESFDKILRKILKI
jgi:predicted CopG family antitoxin